MQLIYEASAQCTSIIGIDENGYPIHARTMDWEMPFLRPLTIEACFYFCFFGCFCFFFVPFFAQYFCVC